MACIETGKSRFLTVAAVALLSLGTIVSPRVFAADSDIVINEIMYHPDTDCENEEFIEFYNRSATDSVDMSNWQIVDGVTYTFPPGTVLGPGEFAVVCEDIPTFNAYYGTPAVAHLGQWLGKLSNNGEPIELVNSLVQTIQLVRYNDKRPWPISADGAGPSLERVNPNDDNTSAGYWRAANANTFSTVWTYHEVVGVPTSTTVYFYLDGAGSCLIDDIKLELTASPLTNYINNGDFQTAAPLEWTAMGNHVGSGRITSDGHNSSACYQINSTGAGGTVSGNVWQVTQPLSLNGPDYTLSFWTKGLQAGTKLRVGMKGGTGAAWTPTAGEDVGSVAAAGSYSYNAGSDTYTVTGSGEDIWGFVDEFYYVYAPLNGDGSLEATVSWVTPNPWFINQWCKAGIMIRESVAADAPNVFALIRSDYLTYLQNRPSNTLNGPAAGGPVRLRLTRQGNDFTAEADLGAGFAPMATLTNYTMASNALIGLAVTSHNDGVLITADFEQVSGSSGSGFFTEVSVPNFMATPGAPNAQFSTNVPPYIRNVDTLPDQPTSADPIEVHAKITDDDGIVSAQLSYQIVSPGNYIRLGDLAYQTNWTNIPMSLSTTPSVYVATIPAQPHRTLVRYRISAQDGAGASTTVPYPTDSEPNYARFVYDGVPNYVAAQRPGVTAPVTHTNLEKVPVIQLIAHPADVNEAQTVEITDKIERREFKWRGTIIFNGTVYDHIRFRMRGGTWRYRYQKRMWKFRFNRGHRLDFLHEDGSPYSEELRTLNMLACIQPPGNVPSWVEAIRGDGSQRGEAGFVDRTGFWLWRQVGAIAPDTTWLHFRIVDDASETGADQYSGDFFGLYLGLQGMDERMLRMSGRPTGNLYKIDSFGTSNPPWFQDAIDCALPTDDIFTFRREYGPAPGYPTPDQTWWETNFDLNSYYSVRAVAECIHHGDQYATTNYDGVESGKNYYYYHDPITNKWEFVGWDIDLSLGTDHGDASEPFRDRIVRNGSIPAFGIAYRNRLREVIQLLFCPEKYFPVLDQWYSMLQEIADADRFRWDWAPDTAPSDGWRTQQGLFEPLNIRLTDIKYWIAQRTSYLIEPETQNWSLETAATWPRLSSWDADIPNTPTLTAPVGGGQFGPNQSIVMTSSAYSDPNGSPHAQSKWIATMVGGNELQPDWTSGETTVDLTSVTIPGGALAPGTYWLRVRYWDNTGRASWWSDAVTVTVSSEASAVRNWKDY